MKYAKVRAAEELRHALIAQVERALNDVSRSDGVPDVPDALRFAVTLVDALDWDHIAELLNL